MEVGRDPYIPQFTRVQPNCNAAQARELIEFLQWRAEAGEGYPFAIADKSANRALGQIGLWLVDPRPFAGYWLAPSARGRGAAARCLDVVTRWAFAELGFLELRVFIEPWNVASMRTAEKAGYKRVDGPLKPRDFNGESRDHCEYLRRMPVVRDLRLEDLPAVREILETWMRDKPGAPVRHDNVEQGLTAMARSIEAPDVGYVVIDDGSVTGVAGFATTGIAFQHSGIRSLEFT